MTNEEEKKDETKEVSTEVKSLESIIEPEVVESIDKKMMVFDFDMTEIKAALEQYKNFEIKGVDDKDGYRKIETAMKYVKKFNNKIKAIGKKARDPQTKHNKGISEVEKGYTGILDEAIESMTNKLIDVDNDITRVNVLKHLPDRKERLAKYGITDMEDETILRMDANFFEDFLANKKTEFLENKVKLMNAKKCQDWLIENGWTEETKDDYKVIQEGEKAVFFKKIGEVEL